MNDLDKLNNVVFDWKTKKGIDLEFKNGVIHIQCFEKGVNTNLDGYGCNLYFYNKDKKRLFGKISNYNKCSKKIIERNIKWIIHDMVKYDDKFNLRKIEELSKHYNEAENNLNFGIIY